MPPVAPSSVERSLGRQVRPAVHAGDARALGALGDTEASLAEWAIAKAVPVVDPEDREIVEADFADAPVTA